MKKIKDLNIRVSPEDKERIRFKMEGRHPERERLYERPQQQDPPAPCLEKPNTAAQPRLLYNAPATMDSYYRTEVNHDLYGR